MNNNQLKKYFKNFSDKDEQILFDLSENFDAIGEQYGTDPNPFYHLKQLLSDKNEVQGLIDDYQFDINLLKTDAIINYELWQSHENCINFLKKYL